MSSMFVGSEKHTFKYIFNLCESTYELTANLALWEIHVQIQIQMNATFLKKTQSVENNKINKLV